jgi:beta-lactamase class A
MRRAQFLAGTAALAAHATLLQSAALADLERRSGGRLGVAVLDTATGLRFGHREHERFAFCSTFKVFAAGALLERVDRGADHLDRKVMLHALPGEYAPVMGAMGGQRATLRAICAAAIEQSDNVAANALIAALGGPAGVTAAWRAAGDRVMRLDRIEPALNTALPGDPRDTVSPAAALDHLQRLTAGDALSPRSRAQLIAWMRACKTGDARLRAGLPKTWIVGDKTGTGFNGPTNDVAVVWRPRRLQPIFVTAYYVDERGPGDRREAVLAQVGRVVAEAVSR